MWRLTYFPKFGRLFDIRWFAIAAVLVVLVIPQKLSMPVAGATKADYNEQSFWYYPWGKSVTHKGVDIFARKGTVVNAPTTGLVLYCGQLELGGNVVLILGPKLRLHYFAHLQEIHVSPFRWLWRKTPIGTVGNSGNAAGKAAHLHYSMVTLIPYPWLIDRDRQGWKKMFYLNPITYLSAVGSV